MDTHYEECCELYNSKLFCLFTNSTFEFLMNRKNSKYLKYILEFIDTDAIDCIYELIQINPGNPNITINSIKMAYKLYEKYNELFIPIYFRSYYGRWQLSSGACSGVVYRYRKDKQTLKYDEFLVFERLSDLLKPNVEIIREYAPFGSIYDNEIYSQDGVKITRR